MRGKESLLHSDPVTAMENFRAAQHWTGRVHCHCCGYEPSEGSCPPARVQCPKCGGTSWETYRFLTNPPVSADPHWDGESNVSSAA